MSGENSLGILIPSCDNYSDAWAPFFHLFFRYLPDPRHPIYLAANQKDFSHHGVKTVRVGPDVDWSTNLIFALDQLARYLAQQGVTPGDHVGIYAHNRVEWLEALFACWKIRAVAVNINFRYVGPELEYLWQDADLVALVYECDFTAHVATLAARFPLLRTYIYLQGPSTKIDGATPPGIDYEVALAAHFSTRNFGQRSADDLYLVYTGGTTGMPKGVLWRHEDF